VVTNPFWLVDDAMLVRAGDPDATYFYRYKPVLFTVEKRVKAYGGAPQMQAFGSRFLLGILRADGTRSCILEIPRWRFGWDQPYRLAEPMDLNPGDQVYVECHFDNSESKQPVIDGVPAPPRDFAWGGNNQDMCAGFITFVEE